MSKEKKKGSWALALFNSNPNRKKVKAITGAKGTKMFKTKTKGK